MLKAAAQLGLDEQRAALGLEQRGARAPALPPAPTHTDAHHHHHPSHMQMYTPLAHPSRWSSPRSPWQAQFRQ